MDHRLGRFMNRNLGEYHIPASADVPPIDVLFVDEPDDKINPLGVKGLGEIGIVGTAAAIGNAIYHATGRRLRHLPMTMIACEGMSRRREQSSSDPPDVPSNRAGRG